MDNFFYSQLPYEVIISKEKIVVNNREYKQLYECNFLILDEYYKDCVSVLLKDISYNNQMEGDKIFLYDDSKTPVSNEKNLDDVLYDKYAIRLKALVQLLTKIELEQNNMIFDKETNKWVKTN